MKYNDTDIAVIGISGRYPKSNCPDMLWSNILSCVDLHSCEEHEHNEQNYINKYFSMNGIELLDNDFFGFTPLDAALTDPQHRVLLLCAYEALIDAGYYNKPNLRIGVFATSSISSYLLNVIMKSEHYKNNDVNHQILIGNDKDFVATRIAYKLNLNGPAVMIQCACSSSLVAIHYAVQNILSGECDAAIVGGVSISIPQNRGYYYKEGGILSKDGICRPFDDRADGIIKGNGCSVIMLKKLKDANRDKDKVYCIIKGTAVNNDGKSKIGYVAPSIDGQSSVINEAIEKSGLTIDDIEYVETHGTGTKLGDLIELTALNNVFKGAKHKIPLGSIKANIGHLDVAAGISSLIKCIYMLNRNTIPALKNFRNLNDGLYSVSNNFLFPTEQKNKNISCIGISSFGMGGTNAHIIISKYSDMDATKMLGKQVTQIMHPRAHWIEISDKEVTQKKNERPVFFDKDVKLGEITDQIIKVWISGLGLNNISEDTNYFNTGGDSLCALELLDCISKKFNVKLDLNDLQSNVTPKSLSILVKNRKSLEKHPFISHIRKSNKNNISIFLVHPAGGTTFCYNALNRYVSKDCNIFSIDLPEDYAQFNSMKELGEHYLSEIMKFTNDTSYILGGYSFGGNLAYEIASNAEKRGHTVSKVIMFDSHPPEAYKQHIIKPINYQGIFPDILSCYFGRQFGKINCEGKSLSEVLDIMRAEKMIDTKLTNEQLMVFFNKWIFNHKLLKAHNADAVINSDLILFGATEKEDASILENLNMNIVPKNIWNKYFKKETKILNVGGNHYTLFNNANIEFLANCFDSVIIT